MSERYINTNTWYIHLVIVDFCGWLGAGGGGADPELDDGGGGGLGRSPEDPVALGGDEWNVACITTAATLGCSLCGGR